jgi:hypothetical protein
MLRHPDVEAWTRARVASSIVAARRVGFLRVLTSAAPWLVLFSLSVMPGFLNRSLDWYWIIYGFPICTLLSCALNALSERLCEVRDQALFTATRRR